MKIVDKIIKWIKLPTPVDLGKSKYNALPSRWLPNEEGEYTWEDYYEEMKEKYPVRYFFFETLSDFIRFRIFRRIDNAWYYIWSRFLVKQHLLDLRQPKELAKGEYYSYEDNYQWGYLDFDSRILLACFNMLVEYRNCRLEGPYEVSHGNEHDDEVERLYYYWTVERKANWKKYGELLSKAYNRENPPPKEEKNKLRKEVHEIEESIHKKDEEMLISLMKIRRGLWT